MPTLEEFKADPDLMFDFMSFFLKFNAYDYQKPFLRDCLLQDRIAGVWCRQSGKSLSVSNYIAFRSIITPTSTMITGPGLSQTGEFFAKIRKIFEQSDILLTQVKKLTMTELELKNGSRVKALPRGQEGKAIRGFTADIIVMEEAGLLDDHTVNTAITPLIAATGQEGTIKQIIKIGTPLNKNHFYRSCFVDPTYHVSIVKWPVCVKQGQYTKEFVEQQKENITDIEFKTEYECDFVEEISSYFPLELIKSCMEDYVFIKVY
jgi:hypothetical protein